MPIQDNWFEKNQGFINFSTQLIAINQRDQLIQEQLQANVLLGAQLDLENERRNEQIAQDHKKNLLYEINQAAELAAADYPREPLQAYDESVLLMNKVREIKLHHSWFSELEWKQYCSRTITAVSKLATDGRTLLKPEQLNLVENKLRAHKKKELEKRKAAEAESERAQAEIRIRNLEYRVPSGCASSFCLVGSILFVIGGVYMVSDGIRSHDGPTALKGLAGTAFFGLTGCIGLYRLVFGERRELRRLKKTLAPRRYPWISK